MHQTIRILANKLADYGQSKAVLPWSGAGWYQFSTEGRYLRPLFGLGAQPAAGTLSRETA